MPAGGARGGSVGAGAAHRVAPLRIATRLVLVLSAAVAAVVLAYSLISIEQRATLLRDALIRETETLARTLQIVAENDAGESGGEELNRVLEGVLADPETYAAVTIDDAERVLSGGTDGGTDGGTECLDAILRDLPSTTAEAQGWTECDERVRWVLLPSGTAGAAVLLARRATLLERDVNASRLRLLLLTLVLAGTAAIVIFFVLHRALSAPLGEILRGVHLLGTAGGAERVVVPPAAGELHELGAAFNRMADQLDARRRSLLRQGAERLAMERQLREAETFAVAGRLTGGVLHELGSPLAVIGMRVDAIADHAAATPQLRSQSEAIRAELDRIAKLIEGLMRITRHHEIALEPVDVAGIVRAVVAELQPRCREAGIEPLLRLPGFPIMVSGHAVLIRHAIFNLANNAVQALARHPGEKRLIFRVERQETAVCVVVEDTGPGIPMHHLERVFEPFFTTKGISGGTGLGLGISRSIAEEHGGTLSIGPGADGGTRAALELPAERAF